MAQKKKRGGQPKPPEKKKVKLNITIDPVIAEDFQKFYKRKTSARIQELMQKDLQPPH